MKTYVLDTNILLYIIRGKQKSDKIKNFLSNQEDLLLIISIVSMAEIQSIVRQAGNWGDEKIEKLNELLQQLTIINIESGNRELIESYVNIDAFSQGKIPAPNGQKLGMSSRNMGKNDLWIAATAYALNAVLLTTDNDFDHLHNLFFQVKKF